MRENVVLSVMNLKLNERDAGRGLVMRLRLKGKKPI